VQLNPMQWKEPAKNTAASLEPLAYLVMVIGAVNWGLISLGGQELNLVVLLLEKVSLAGAAHWVYGAVGASGLIAVYNRYIAD